MSNEIENEFTIIWEIENYSLSDCENGKNLESPPVSIGMCSGSKWSVRLYPAGDNAENKDYVSCFLFRHNDDVSPEEITIGFTINIIGGNDLLVTSLEENNHTFPKGKGWGWYKVMSKHELLSEMKKWYEDTLTIRCCIVNKNKVIGCLAKTKICFDWCYGYLWEINIPDSSEWCMCRPFTFAKICPIKVTLTAPEDDILINIQKAEEVAADDVPPRFITCRILLLDNEGVERHSKSSSYFLIDDDWQFPTFIKKSFLKENACDFLDNGVFKLKISFNIPNQKELKEIVSYMNEESKTDVTRVLQNDLRSVFLNEKFSDVKFKVDEVVLPSHKCIVAARSPVFSAMFEHNLLETQTGIVEIPELEENTLKHFLQFMYTGAMDNINYDIALKLLLTADKYQVESLKEKCASYLISILSNDNALDVLVSADLIGHNYLRTSTVDYIISHGAIILVSSKWSEWVGSNVNLATEIIGKLTSKLSLKAADC